MIRIGEQIPEIESEVYHEGKFKKISLSDYKGKWLVLLFYPADFTFVCPTELQEAARLYPKFQENNAEIISVSTDTKFTHKAWHDNSPAIKEITYPMLADPSGKVCKIFGTLIEEAGESQRASIIINQEGIVKAIDIHDNDIGRSGLEILRKLQAAKYVSENPGLVCPASWTPGKETLRPGEELVGKI